jgi:hypothetical protein
MIKIVVPISGFMLLGLIGSAAFHALRAATNGKKKHFHMTNLVENSV